MENVIYNELRTRGYLVDVAVVEQSEKSEDDKFKKQYEVDFVANLGSKRYYIQSALSLLDEEKLKRELRFLSLIGDSFPKLIVTRDKLKLRCTEEGIFIINLFDFLLENEVFEHF